MILVGANPKNIQLWLFSLTVAQVIIFSLHFDHHGQFIYFRWLSNLHFLLGLTQNKITYFGLFTEALLIYSEESPVIKSVTYVILVAVELKLLQPTQWSFNTIFKLSLPNNITFLILAFQVKHSSRPHNRQIDFKPTVLKISHNPNLLHIEYSFRWFLL